jgi:hypothetical protein
MVVIRAGVGAAAEKTTVGDPDVTMTTTASVQDPLNMTATTDQVEGVLEEMKMTDVIETRNAGVRQVQEKESRARLPNHNLLKMSVTGEPFSSSSLPLVSVQKS